MEKRSEEIIYQSQLKTKREEQKRRNQLCKTAGH